MFVGRTGLVVPGDTFLDIDEYCVVDRQGRQVDYHSEVTFKAGQAITQATFVYHAGVFSPMAETWDSTRVRVGERTQQDEISTLLIGFEPPVGPDESCRVPLSTTLEHSTTTPLSVFVRYTGEEQVSRFRLSVYFRPESAPKRVLQVRFGVTEGERIFLEEHEATLGAHQNGDTDDDNLYANLTLTDVPPRLGLGFRWEW